MSVLKSRLAYHMLQYSTHSNNGQLILIHHTAAYSISYVFIRTPKFYDSLPSERQYILTQTTVKPYIFSNCNSFESVCLVSHTSLHVSNNRKAEVTPLVEVTALVFEAAAATLVVVTVEVKVVVLAVDVEVAALVVAIEAEVKGGCGS